MSTHMKGMDGGLVSGATKIISRVLVLARAFQDPKDGRFYVESPHLDIIGSGHTSDEARMVFDEAIRLTLDDWTEDGVLEQRLCDRGFAINEVDAGACRLLMMLPPGVEIGTVQQSPQMLPQHYQIQSIPYNINMGTACTA